MDPLQPPVAKLSVTAKLYCVLCRHDLLETPAMSFCQPPRSDFHDWELDVLGGVFSPIPTPEG